MQNLHERARHASPAPLPQPLAFHGTTLWCGAWGTSHLYAIDPATWSVIDDVAAPGKPFGLTAFGDELRVVISHGEDDDRYLYRFVPGQGFDVASKTPCPDLTGSHLASDGETLYLVQSTFQRIVALDANAVVKREIALPTRNGGLGFGAGAFYLITADEEFDELQLATLDLTSDVASVGPIAAMPVDARSLAFDGTAWWTSLRDRNEIIAFGLPTVAISR